MCRGFAQNPETQGTVVHSFKSCVLMTEPWGMSQAVASGDEASLFWLKDQPYVGP